MQRVKMPAGARLLHVQAQDVGGPHAVPQPMLWAQVDPNAPVVDRLIVVVGTGQAAPDPDPDDAVYVGTAICGQIVLHVFDGGEIEEGEIAKDVPKSWTEAIRVVLRDAPPEGMNAIQIREAMSVRWPGKFRYVTVLDIADELPLMGAERLGSWREEGGPR